MLVLVALGLAGALFQVPQTLANAAPPGAIAGRVVDDATHAPIADARVMLVRLLTAPPTGPMMNRPLETTTDENGRYAFENVQPGRYTINVQKPGFVVGIPGEPRRPIDVRSGERQEAGDLVLGRGGVIAGRVENQSGQPIAEARVLALRRPPAVTRGAAPPRPPLIATAGSASTNDLGEFRLFGLPPGEYYVQASPRLDYSLDGGTPRATVLASTYYPGTLDPAAAQPVSVVSGQEFSGIAIRLLVVPAFQIAGMVVDEAGSPVSGAMVSMTQDRPAGSMMARPGPTRTDANGRFRIANVIDGTYVMAAAAPIVIASAPARGIGSGAVTSNDGGIVRGFVGIVGEVTTTTETVNGVTTQFRITPANRVTVTVNGANVTGLRLVAPR